MGGNGSLVSSYLMGVLTVLVGFFVHPLVMILGGIIVISAAIIRLKDTIKAKVLEKGLEGESTAASKQVA